MRESLQLAVNRTVFLSRCSDGDYEAPNFGEMRNTQAS